MTFVVVDYIFCFVILIFAILGVVKGFIDNIFGKLSWILGIIGAFFFYDQVARNVLYGIKNPIVGNILAFIILFIVIFLIVKLAQVIIGKLFEGQILGSLDRALGFFFGLVEGIAIVALIIFLLSNQPFFNIDNIFDGSFFYSLFNRFLPNVNFNQIQELGINV